MAEKLTNILGNLVKTPGSSIVNSAYKTEALGQTTDFLQEFSTINPGTTEGLKKYTELTGKPTKNVPINKIELNCKKTNLWVGQNFTSYINHHIVPIAGEISEIGQAEISYEFCPSEEIKPGKYETTRKQINSAKEKIKMIEEEPNKYLEEELAKEDEAMKGLMALLPEETCKIDKINAKEGALANIAKYNTTNFLTETYNHQKTIGDGLNKERAELDKERAELDKNMTPGLGQNAEAYATYFAKINTEEAKLEERVQKNGSFDKLRGTVLGTAIETIKNKEAEKETS